MAWSTDGVHISGLDPASKSKAPPVFWLTIGGMFTVFRMGISEYNRSRLLYKMTGLREPDEMKLWLQYLENAGGKVH